ncbi:MAG: hypothetical protein K2K80_05150, partial [Clostridia bacterium]|nr:hypothetical protein [Clostridia bacterium]
MKKINLSRKLYILAFTAIIIIAVLCFAPLFGNSVTAKASDESNDYKYGFYYEQFSVTYDISSNRKIAVREELTVHYMGHSSTGFIRDLPVNGGELVRNVKVVQRSGDKEVSVTHYVESYQDDDYNEYISVDIGDKSNKYDKVFTYVLTYDYCLTKAQEGDNKLALNLMGPQDRRVEKFSAKLILPDGYESGTYSCGMVGTTQTAV